MSDELELATRALKHFNEGTTDLAPSQMRIPLSAYTDEQQYQVERQAVFFESPIAVALSLEVPEPGDFQTQTVMDIPLLMTRDRDGRVHCFINVCRHRGSLVCLERSGTIRKFSCPYHGWVFGMDGSLVDVPLEKQAYHNEIDKDALFLKKVRVESYKGFVFGTFDEEAPSLEEYLGGMAWYMDSFMDVPGGCELIGPPMKSILDCNWKNPTENFIGDGYHVGWAHASALEISGGPLAIAKGNAVYDAETSGLQVTVPEGHGFGVIWEGAAALHGGPVFEAYQKWLDEMAGIREYFEEYEERLPEKLLEEHAKVIFWSLLVGIVWITQSKYSNASFIG